MAVARLKFLSKDEEEIVHAQSLKCLDDLGVAIQSPSVLKMLDDNGANIDSKKGIAKIPEDMVNEAIKKAPKSIRLGARDPKRDLLLPVESHPYISTGGVTVAMLDLETGQERDATRKDLADFARLTDYLDPIDAFWPIVTVKDVPANAHMVHELWVSLQNTTKHILGSLGSATLGVPDAKRQIAIGELVSGGVEEMKKRPPFSILSCIIAPLTFERGSVEAQIEYAKAGIPVISMSMSLGGMSSPVTVAGTILNANSENLASLVITQFARAGAPHIYSAESTLVNMKTGFIDYLGAEYTLISSALGQMATRYGLPKMTGCMGIDAEKIGNPTQFGETAANVMTTMSGTDLCSGAGGIDNDRACALEQVVVDAYLWEDFRAFMRKFEINEKTFALDVIREVGHGNTFLSHPHTARNFRNEIYFRKEKMELYGATRSDIMVPDARDVVKKALSEHRVDPLDKDIIERGDKIIGDYEKELSKG
ncbi:MAG TPA: hypothetical protein ENN25_01720 [Euryarchaeota archaeon]|nr:hypothetical protein [Euryarchaeota archaeon]